MTQTPNIQIANTTIDLLAYCIECLPIDVDDEDNLRIARQTLRYYIERQQPTLEATP